ncbi:MAG: deoxynucleoside kinase [Candidatus Coatesbacteria bacterium]
MPDLPKYIVVEGPIGVGKTTVAEALAREINARVVLEAVEENPFLPRFYKDMRSFAFQTQLFFLLSRYRQQQDLQQGELFKKNTVADYLFAKDRLFAYLTLEEEELKLYERLHGMLNERILKPDLVIYLHASAEVLLDRVRGRGRAWERAISREYLEEVVRAYNYYFFHFSEAPLMVVNTNEVDLAHNPAQLKDLVRRMGEVRSGTHYFKPA